MPEVPDTVDDALEPLSSPSTDQVFEATRPFSAREIASAAASEALSGGGGGSQTLAQVLADGNDTNGVAITHADSSLLFSDSSASLETPLDIDIRSTIQDVNVTADTGDINITTDPDNGSNVNLSAGLAVQLASHNDATLSATADGHMTLSAGRYTHLESGFGSGAAARMLENGGMWWHLSTSPVADEDLPGAGYFAFWFDDTNGAAKFKIKGKTADGTVVNGEVTLTP